MGSRERPAESEAEAAVAVGGREAEATGDAEEAGDGAPTATTNDAPSRAIIAPYLTYRYGAYRLRTIA